MQKKNKKLSLFHIPNVIGIIFLNFIGISNSYATDIIINNLVDDLKNNISTVVKTGTCSRNPFLLKQNTVASTPTSYAPPYTNILPPCLPVVAQCPFGTKLLPKVSRCSLQTSGLDTETLAFLNKIDSNYAPKLSDPNGMGMMNKNGGAIKNMSDLPSNKQQCDSQAYVQFLGYQTGYSPFCAFDLSKVETLSTGESQFFIPRSINGNLVSLGYQTGSPQITMTELENSANYKCYTAYIQATAFCMTAPVSFNNLLKKLRVPDPYVKH